MEKYIGIIWIRNTDVGSKYDGNKAYFIDSDFNHYQLYRKGIFEVNDEYFNPFQLKTVEIMGEIQKQKWIMVDNIEIIKDSLVNTEEKK